MKPISNIPYWTSSGQWLIPDEYWATPLPIEICNMFGSVACNFLRQNDFKARCFEVQILRVVWAPALEFSRSHCRINSRSCRFLKRRALDHLECLTILPRSLQQAIDKPHFSENPDVSKPTFSKPQLVLSVRQFHWGTACRFIQVLMPHGASVAFLLDHHDIIQRPFLEYCRTGPFQNFWADYIVPRDLWYFICVLKEPEREMNERFCDHMAKDLRNPGWETPSIQGLLSPSSSIWEQDTDPYPAPDIEIPDADP